MARIKLGDRTGQDVLVRLFPEVSKQEVFGSGLGARPDEQNLYTGSFFMAIVPEGVDIAKPPGDDFLSLQRLFDAGDTVPDCRRFLVFEAYGGLAHSVP